MTTFYYRPTTLEEARQYLRLPDSFAIAGGALTFTGLTLPHTHIIDLQNVAALQRIESTAADWRIGGAVRLPTLVAAADLPAILRQSITRALSPNQQNGASVGESLLAAAPLREWLTALAVLETVIHHLTPDGQLHEQPLEDFIRATYSSNYRGIITQLVIPRRGGHTAIGSARVARTPADTPIVNAAVLLGLGTDHRVDSAWTVIGGASPEPIRRIDLTHLVGNPLNDQSIQHAAQPIAPLVNPVGDYRGSVEYRREMARVCVRRALIDAAAQG